VIDDIAAAPSDPTLQGVIREAAQSAGLSTVDMPSGAVHDAGEISRIAPMGMIFVPSHDGISHAPQEFTSWRSVPTAWKTSTAAFYCLTIDCNLAGAITDSSLLDRDGHGAEVHAVGYRLHLERETIFASSGQQDDRFTQTLGCCFKEFGACHAHPLGLTADAFLTLGGGNRLREYFV